MEDATILFGYYNYEKDRQERDTRLFLETTEKIISYLIDVKSYLEQTNERTLETNKAWAEVVFGDNRILEDVTSAKELIERNIVPEERLFRRLMLYVEAFSYESGIRLKLLGLNKEDGYDKLPAALSKDLIYRGQSFLQDFDEYVSFYQSITLFEVRKRIDVFLQNHIYTLLDQTIMESMIVIKKLREDFSEKVNDRLRTSDHPEDSIEALMRKIDEVIKSLAKKLNMDHLGREEVIRSITLSQQQFIEKYQLQINSILNLLPSHLQTECLNYLVTSEVVYRGLSSREDKDKLDFSSALIPLTKAMELILNFVYEQMDVVEYENIDPRTRNVYFYREKKKDSIEFGPCIYLLSDGFIHVKEVHGQITFNWSKPYMEHRSRFKLWGGDKVVHFKELKKFAGIHIKFQKNNRSSQILQATFTTDDEYNRMLFIKGLEFIKDNYRNVVAHKDGIKLETFQEARSILLQIEKLLWILIYLLK